MTVQSFILDLLAYIGITSFSSEGTGIDPKDDNDINKAIAATNEALQVLFDKGPRSLKFDERSSFLHLPTTVTVTIDEGETIATFLDGNADWMAGCSILIDGDGILNRIKEISGATATLLSAYLGASGEHQATVYGDGVLLEEDVKAVIEPVYIPRFGKLTLAQSVEEFNAARYAAQYDPSVTTLANMLGTPTRYLVQQLAGCDSGELFLTLNPMPGFKMNVTYNVYRKPQVIERSEDFIAEDGGDDPEASFAIPSEMIESYLQPIARWKFFTHPSLLNNEARASVKEEHDRALASLMHGVSLEPVVGPTRACYI